jgi:hypothetical protein
LQDRILDRFRAFVSLNIDSHFKPKENQLLAELQKIDHSPAQVLDYGRDPPKVKMNARLTLSDYLDTYKNPPPYHISLDHKKILLLEDPEELKFKAHNLIGSWLDKVTKFSSVYLNKHIYVIGGWHNDLPRPQVSGRDYSKPVD